MKLETEKSYVTNPQFVGGTNISDTFLSGSQFESASADNPQWGYVAGGMYIGSLGDLTAKTVDGSVLTFASASGFIPGIFCAVSESSTVRNVVVLR
jgi:hypothetical protein